MDGGECPASRYGHFMPWEKEFPVTVEQEYEGALEPALMFWRRVKKRLSLALLRHTRLFTSTCRVCRTGCVQLEGFDVHQSVHRDGIMKVTNKLQLYRIIYFS